MFRWRLCAQHGRGRLSPCCRNTFRDNAVCKYLRSNAWMFNKIACLSTHEVGFLFSTSGSPKVTPTPAACTGPRLSGRAPRLPPAGMFCPLLLTSPLTSTLPGAPSPASSFSPHSRLVRCRVSYSFVRRACFDCWLRAKHCARRQVLLLDLK